MAQRVWKDIISALWGYEHGLALTVRDIFMRPRVVYEHYKQGGNRYFSPFRVIAVIAGILFLLDKLLVDYADLMEVVAPPAILQRYLPIKAQQWILKVLHGYQVLFQVLSIPIFCLGLHRLLPKRIKRRYTNSIVIVTYAACMVLLIRLVLFPLKYISYTGPYYIQWASTLNVVLIIGFYFGLLIAMLRLRGWREWGRLLLGFVLGWLLVWVVLVALALVIAH